jgi:hypothetical protein
MAAGIIAAIVVVVVLAARWLFCWVRARRSQSPEEAERLRRIDVSRRGRIASAQIVDLITGEAPGAGGRVLVYRYEVAGVTYEASQDVSGLAGVDVTAEGLAGLESAVKYDPRKPSNSIIVCEDWSGLKRSPTAAVNGGE